MGFGYQTGPRAKERWSFNFEKKEKVKSWKLKGPWCCDSARVPVMHVTHAIPQTGTNPVHTTSVWSVTAVQIRQILGVYIK